MEKHKAARTSHTPNARLTIFSFTVVERHLAECEMAHIRTDPSEWTPPSSRVEWKNSLSMAFVHSLRWIRRCTSDRKRKSMQATWKLNIMYMEFLFFLSSHSCFRTLFSCKSFNVFYNTRDVDGAPILCGGVDGRAGYSAQRFSWERANLIQSCECDYVDFCSVRLNSLFPFSSIGPIGTVIVVVVLLLRAMLCDRFDSSFFPARYFHLIKFTNFLIWFMVFVFSWSDPIYILSSKFRLYHLLSLQRLPFAIWAVCECSGVLFASVFNRPSFGKTN